MNSVTITGRLTADPTTRSAGTQDVTQFRVAIDNSANPTTYVDCEAWGRLGSAVVTHLRKGRFVAVLGSLRHAEWTDRAEQHHQRHYITATSVDFLDRPARVEPDAAVA